IGNTRLKWAMYEDHRPGRPCWLMVRSFWSTLSGWRKELGGLPAPDHMLGCVVAGETAGGTRADGRQMLGWDFEPQWVVPSTEEAGITNGYDHPSRLGADRWVAMIGSRHHMLQLGEARPLITVMVGTAVTVDAMDAQGHFLGGLIIPGHGIMLKALEGGTAGLHVPTGEVRASLKPSDALTSGGTAIAGAVGACISIWPSIARRSPCASWRVVQAGRCLPT
nr:type III pantothenate kinase [Staphylococcus epidermidis]